ncbi:MAG TPA: hypothetical protein VFN11_05550 [Ktedonobacterales bacterium]|nr:hypothetical protein [Ktedonobacterales bacterium]
MTDDEFVQAFLSGSLPQGDFHHRDHLRLAWVLVRLTGRDEAMKRITSGIRYFATEHGHAEKYHETMTRFWVRIVAHAVAARPDITTFDGFLAAYPLLLEKDLPYRHWRRETMLSSDARARWVEPDLQALPA